MGDIITNLESIDEEWFVGDLRGKRALVPKNYVQVLWWWHVAWGPEEDQDQRPDGSSSGGLKLPVSNWSAVFSSN